MLNYQRVPSFHVFSIVLRLAGWASQPQLVGSVTKVRKTWANTKQHKTQLPSWWRKPRTAAARRTSAQALSAKWGKLESWRHFSWWNQGPIGWQGWRRWRHVWVYASSFVRSLYGHGNSFGFHVEFLSHIPVFVGLHHHLIGSAMFLLITMFANGCV